jgi:hypothetical protein
VAVKPKPQATAGLAFLIFFLHLVIAETVVTLLLFMFVLSQDF